MPLYLFRFGYETPAQYHGNQQHGWDDEDSAGVVIDAPTPEAAEEWGRDVAEQFVRWLFGNNSVSWRRDNYAHGVEPCPIPRPAYLPHVRLGELPDFTTLR